MKKTGFFFFRLNQFREITIQKNTQGNDMKRNILTLSALILLCLATLEAKFDIDISTTNGSLSNKMKEQSLFTSMISANSLDLSYLSETYFSALAGVGNVQYFSSPTNSYTTFYIGTGFNDFFGDIDDVSYSIILMGNIRVSAEVNSLSDSKQAIGLMQFNYLTSETSLLDFSNNLKYKRYNEIVEFSFIENQIASKFTKSFQTKTTLQLGMQINTKYHNNFDALFNDNDNLYKKNKKLQYNKSATQLIFEAAAAQNIFENTGLRFSFQQSNYLSDYDTPLEFVGFDVTGDGEFFDDPFSFEKNQIEIKLTQILPLGVKAVLSYKYADKNYNYMVLVEDDIYTDRRDYNSSIELSLEKRIPFESSFLNSLDVKIDYEYYRNNSTFSQLNYNGSYFLVTLEFGL